MTLTFISNYINHHQIPVSDVLYQHLGKDYHFIQVMPMEEERSGMGWSIDRSRIPYLRCYYEEPKACRDLISESDMVVFGGVEDESYIEGRLETGKPVIRYSERLYREGQWKAISPRGLLKKYHDHTRYRKAEVYLLCSGAYTASDFTIVRAYPGKMYKWGYFTEFKEYDMEDLFGKKKGDPVEILFAARFIPLKHPEYPIELAGKLKEKGIPFHLTMTGDGEMMDGLRARVVEKGLSENVSFTGFMSPSQVRSYMEGADIFIISSDHLEGWGAVIPEAMNSGCAVIAGSGIGAVPYLLRHEINGMVYREGDMDEFLAYGERLCTDTGFRKSLGEKAYGTIRGLWNPGYAARSLLRFAEGILKGIPAVNDEGPLSPAPIIWPRQGYAYTRR